MVPHAHATSDPLIGKTVHGYRILERIGEGGMGAVYRAQSTTGAKPVALKIGHSELASDATALRRFADEVRAMHALRHPDIVEIYGVGQLEDGRHYVAMEFVRGVSLDDELRWRGALPVSQALHLLSLACIPLGAVHEKGFIHRDLKPENILLYREAGQESLKLVDFGLAKRATLPGVRAEQTTNTQVTGTPDYMAPEQARGRSVSPQTDIYALGVITFRMLTGQLPFVGKAPMDVMLMHVSKTPPAPSSIKADIPKDVDALVAHLLEKEPDRRPKDANALLLELASLPSFPQVKVTVRQTPSGKTDVVSEEIAVSYLRWRRYRPVLAVLAVLALLVTAVGVTSRRHRKAASVPGSAARPVPDNTPAKTP